MTEDAFHLTAHDVRAQEFHRVLRGYDPGQVEEFKQRMSEEIDRLVRDRVQLDERVKGMSEQLKSYRDRERAMNDALVSAQQLRADSQTQADRERDLLLREAQLKVDALLAEARNAAESIVQNARAEELRLRHGNESARRQFHVYLTSYRQLLERQLQEIAVLGGDGAATAPPAAVPVPVPSPGEETQLAQRRKA
ncbi:MAG TPA: DivIVA domain-containing protein [Gemmatimonadales bacterium]|jgi:DivIVA domain-containing protein|nr:DivIVA domain-containing protein [Gemmatimonadales bacterium]